MTAIKQKVCEMERFTAKPKWWGKLRHKSKLKASEFMVLDVIFEKTIDWGKTTDKISISQFQKELGLSNRNIIDSLDGLKKKGLIFILGRERKTNTISIKMAACEEFALAETGEKSSQDKKPTGENFSQSGEKSSYQLVKKVHTHDTRYHYPIPFIYIKGYPLLKNYDVDPKVKKHFEKKAIDQTAKDLIDFWNHNHGKSKSANVKSSVWLPTVKARLKKFTVEEIQMAMLSVIKSVWHQQNGQVLIKNAISSDKRCDDAIARYNQIINTQGNTHANSQSTTATAKKSSADQYAENLAEELAQRFPDEFGVPF